MKKQLLLFLFILSLSGLKAQTSVYHPFPKENAVWINARGTYDVDPWPYGVHYYPETPDRYCLPGSDTLIGGHSYSKVYRCGSAYDGALRDDSIARKVYYVPADSASELLIYDFSVHNGDTANVYERLPSGPEFYPAQYVYSYTDSVLINGSYRKRVSFSGEPGRWIEGIGSTQGLFREGWANVSNYYTSLDCMSHSDTTLYPAMSIGPCSLTEGIATIESKNAVELYPNPTTGTCRIETGYGVRSKMEIKDILGNTMLVSDITGSATIDLSDRAQGIYFIRISDSKGNSTTKKIVKQ